MNGFLSYILNFLPILLGIGAFYLIKSVRITGKKIKIYQNGKDRQHAPKGHLDSHEKPDSSRFENLILEELIIRGKLGKRKISNYFSEGFSEAGIIGTDNLQRLPDYAMEIHRRDITLFLREKEVLFGELLAFGKVSGILIGYSSNCKIRFSG